MPQENNRTDQRHPAEMPPCPRCHGGGKVHAGPYICSTCQHGTSGVCARNHGTATPWKTCSEWKPVDADSGRGEDIADGTAKPKVIVLSGSSRFVQEMAVCAWLLERDEGAIAMGLHLLPWWYPNVPDHHLAEHEGVAPAMDQLHLRKIDLADEVFVVNVGSYIGTSTLAEIGYAQAKGIPLRWYTHDLIGARVAAMVEDSKLGGNRSPACGGAANECCGGEIVGFCGGCSKPLTQSEIAFRYAGGDPVMCENCKPTPEELEQGRRDCAQAAITLWGKVEKCEHFDTCGCVPEFRAATVDGDHQ